ncbi:MAG: Rrf2 family transcriptional regulator [Nitrospinota bacterium]|nr:Rrf2 family transcriptional regulator [Nitrospinota bacterium]
MEDSTKHLEQRINALEREVDHLYKIQECTASLISSLDFDETLNIILSTARDTIGAEHGSILLSRKVPGGGFVLAHPPGEISLWIIVLAIDGRDPFEDCVAGWPSCSEENVCPLHERWKPVKTGLHEFLESTTLEDMVRAVTETKASEIPLASGGLKLFAGKSLPGYPQGSGR